MGEYNLGIDDEPLSFIERKVKTLVMHPKYQGSYQDKAVKTFASLDILMKQFGIEDSNPFLSNSLSKSHKTKAEKFLSHHFMLI